MKRKNVIRTLTVVAVVLLLGWSFFYFSDDTRGYHQVDTSVAVAQINAGNVTGAQIDDREQQVRLDLKSVTADTDNSNKIITSFPTGYAVPLFVRIVTELAHTSTFKSQKVELRKQGYGEDVKDPLYVLAGKSEGYVPFYPEYVDEVVDGKRPK